MPWFFIVLLAAALAIGLLVALRAYERDSAAAARREVEALRAELEAVQQRVAALETIAAEDRNRLEAPPAAPEEPLPGAAEASPRTRRQRS